MAAPFTVSRRTKTTKRDGLIGFERGQRLVNYCGSPCGISIVSAAAAGTVEWWREPQYYNFGGLLWSRRIASAWHKTICVYMQCCSANYLNWGQAQCMFGCVYSNCSAARHMCRGASAGARRPLWARAVSQPARWPGTRQRLIYWVIINTSPLSYMGLLLTCHFTAMPPSYQWLTLFHNQLFRTHFRPPFFRSLRGILRGWCLLAVGYRSELLTLVTLVTSHSVVSIVWSWSSAGSLEMEAASRWLLHSSVINQSNVSPSFQLQTRLYFILFCTGSPDCPYLVSSQAQARATTKFSLYSSLFISKFKLKMFRIDISNCWLLLHTSSSLEPAF